MMKFATALCLLVTVTGIHGSSLSTVMKEELNEVVTQIEEYQTKLETIITNIEESSKSAISSANSTIYAVAAEYQAAYDSLVENVSGDVSSCETAFSSASSKGKSILANATTCINNVEALAQTDANTFKAKLNNVTSSVKNLLDEVSDCDADSIFTFWSCVATIDTEMVSDMSNWSTILSDVATFMTEITDFADEFSVCSETAGVATYATDMKAAYETAEECVSEVTSES
ncbi:uncharacterized protein [Neodiprion pinetum]|uniref:uncharacterized protein n=1 Tax=Neodiprion pinetum TaxID=441929 RepID=UPI001EDE52B1|nr:uncharacterized protein LOC124219474 [Neodiprion pinetum]